MPKERVLHSLYSDGTGQVQYLIEGKYYSQNPSQRSEAVAQQWINIRDTISDMSEGTLKLTKIKIVDYLVEIGIPIETANLLCNAIIQKKYLSINFAILPEFVHSGQLKIAVIDRETLEVTKERRVIRG